VSHLQKVFAAVAWTSTWCCCFNSSSLPLLPVSLVEEKGLSLLTPNLTVG